MNTGFIRLSFTRMPPALKIKTICNIIMNFNFQSLEEFFTCVHCKVILFSQWILRQESARGLPFCSVHHQRRALQAEMNHLGTLSSHCYQKCVLARFGKRHRLLSGNN